MLLWTLAADEIWCYEGDGDLEAYSDATDLVGLDQQVTRYITRHGRWCEYHYTAEEYRDNGREEEADIMDEWAEGLKASFDWD